VQQAAKRLGIGIRKVYELCAAGDLPSHKIGRQIRLRPDDLDAFEHQAVTAEKRKSRSDPERHFR